MGTSNTCSATRRSRGEKNVHQLFHHLRHNVVEQRDQRRKVDDLLRGALLNPLLRQHLKQRCWPPGGWCRRHHERRTALPSPPRSSSCAIDIHVNRKGLSVQVTTKEKGTLESDASWWWWWWWLWTRINGVALSYVNTSLRTNCGHPQKTQLRVGYSTSNWTECEKWRPHRQKTFHRLRHVNILSYVDTDSTSGSEFALT